MDTISQNDKQITVIPPGHWFFRNSLEVLKDPLAFFKKTFIEYGDFYDVNANFFNIYVVANPDYIQEIMVTNKTDYGKSDVGGMAYDLVLAEHFAEEIDKMPERVGKASFK